jgi:hypothetical protein
MGHDLANLALRVVADNSSACTVLQGAGSSFSKMVAAVRAGGSGRDAWIFHASAHSIATALAASTTGAAKLVKVAARLESTPQWRQMSETRHEYFHRVRYGYANGDTDALAAARDFYDATIDGARTLARAAPAMYHALLQASPKIRSGKLRSFPLMGAISVGTISRDGTRTEISSDLFSRVPFRG